MPRLIDAEFICEHIEKEIKDIDIPRCPYAKRKNSEYDIGYNNGLTMAKAIAMKAPTIEAEPVRHGDWVKYPHGSGIYCSECHKKRRYKDIHDEYCPNCGAKMDGGKDNDQI